VTRVSPASIIAESRAAREACLEAADRLLGGKVKERVERRRRVRSLVLKLEALAASTTFEPERETALAQAGRLRSAYRIED